MAKGRKTKLTSETEVSKASNYINASLCKPLRGGRASEGVRMPSVPGSVSGKQAQDVG